MKRVIYKIRFDIEDDGSVKMTPFVNRRVPYYLRDEMDWAARELQNRLNGKSDWKKSYIFFEHDGVKYRQVDADPDKLPCEGCVFNDDKDGHSCQHPYYFSSKGRCTGKIYKKE